MIDSDQLQGLQAQLQSAQTILILLSPQASFDEFASALALHQVLTEMGKLSTLAAPAMPRRERFADLIGSEQLTTTLGNKNLQISFPYQEDQVDKVSYHIDEDEQRFNLVVQPKRGVRPLDGQLVAFTYTGAEADLIVTIGISSLESLEEMYFSNEDIFNTATLVSINVLEPTFGMIKLNVGDLASYCDAMTIIFQTLGAGVSADVATNLLSGIESATDNFRSLSTTPDTFEHVALLMRAGARRIRRTDHAAIPSTPGTSRTNPFARDQEVFDLPSLERGSTSSFAAAVAQAQRQQAKNASEPLPPKERVAAGDSRPSRISAKKHEVSVSDRVKAAPRAVPKHALPPAAGKSKKMFEPPVSEASRGG